MSAYGRDLAWIHDTGFTTFAREAAPGLLRLLRQNGVSKGLVVDAGSGSGVWARALTDRGYDVLGIDISPAMIALARRHAPAAKFQAGSLFSAKIPACDAVTSIGECVNYAFDRKSGKQGLAAFFRRVHAALRPGGVFLFDTVEPGVSDLAPARRFSEGPGWAILLEVDENRARHTLTRRIVSYRQVRHLYRRSEEIHRLHLYSHDELLAGLAAAGFEAQVLSGYGKFQCQPAHTAFLARQPE